MVKRNETIQKSLNCRRLTCATHCVTPIVLYTNVDAAQCDKLATIVDRTKLTTVAAVDVP